MSKIKVSKHTPGPWRTGDLFGTVFGPPNGNPSPQTIATIHRGLFPTQNQEANARLIAAAPELLRYLKIAEEVLRVCGNDTTEIKSAISKAEGGK